MLCFIVVKSFFRSPLNICNLHIQSETIPVFTNRRPLLLYCTCFPIQDKGKRLSLIIITRGVSICRQITSAIYYWAALWGDTDKRHPPTHSLTTNETWKWVVKLICSIRLSSSACTITWWFMAATAVEQLRYNVINHHHSLRYFYNHSLCTDWGSRVDRVDCSGGVN